MLHDSQLDEHSAWGAAPLQLYVDDPILTVTGSPAQRAMSCGLAVTFWQVLGVPIRWRKGKFYESTEEHTWIGVSFRLLRPGLSRMPLPHKFLEEFVQLGAPFTRGTGHVVLAMAESYVGKAGRISHVLPHVRPFVTALYGALQGAKQAQQAKARDAPPGRAACKRFKSAAVWMQALVTGGSTAPLPHYRDISAEPVPAACLRTR